ncbi:MAG TPA: hypothetical protein VJ719_00350 [Chthoniobacterales bacterium]|nr:hypothetical protein [Chthoniobacterales bacterium]
MQEDENHLDLLAIFHYIVAGLTTLFSLFPLIYVAMGLFFAFAPTPSHGEPPPAFVGWLFVAFGGTFFVVGITLAVCIFAAGRSLHRRTRYWYGFVVACVECIFMPFGTVLGVFTLIVLSRPSVKTRFGLPPSQPPPPPVTAN